jgi:hypothetical protein
MSIVETWTAWPTVWKPKSPQEKWQDGMRALFGNNWQEHWRLHSDELHDGEGGELRLALQTSNTSVCTIMIRTRPHGKQEIRQFVKK